MRTVIFRATGEHRRVKAGDWYENIDGSFKQALFGTAVEHYIYTMEEVNQTEEKSTVAETPSSSHKSEKIFNVYANCSAIEIRLQEENEALKEEIEDLKYRRDSFEKDMRRIDEKMKKELSQVKEERDRFKKAFSYGLTIQGIQGTNDNQPTPVEKTDNIPHSFASLNDRIERVENKLLQHGIY